MLRQIVLWMFCVGVFAAIDAPEECEVWRSGMTYEIEWDTDDLDEEVDIELWEGGDLLLSIATEEENDGRYEWQVPFIDIRFSSLDDCDFQIFIHSSSGYLPTYYFTGDAVLSEGFNLRNPLIWGNANNYDPVNVADTLFKARWSGEVVPSYDISYRLADNTASEVTVTHLSDRREFEDLDDHVISGVLPDTEYEIRMRYTLSNGESSTYTEFYRFRTYPSLECTNEMLSAWLSLEVYDNIRTGDFKYPGLCGELETTFAYVSSSDFVAVYSDRESGRVFVAWRGTESDNIEDAIDNFGLLIECDNAILIDDADCGISSAFALNYEASQVELILRLIEDAIGVGFDTLIVTGHSQGGGLATVAASDYVLRYGDEIRVELITYGCPEVGNEDFVEDITPILPSIIRYVQIDEFGDVDEVVLLPSSIGAYFGFGSDFAFVQFDDSTEVLLECPSDISTCRIHGPGPIPPFYCHCIEGYWRNIARDSFADPGYNDNDNYSTFNIISDWFYYQTSELKTTYIDFFSSTLDASTSFNSFDDDDSSNSCRISIISIALCLIAFLM